MTTIFERYNQPDNFDSTDDIWCTQRTNLDFYQTSKYSISYFCFNVIANAHNNVMASNGSPWTKVPTVVALEAATLTLIPFATVETIARLALAIITSPLFVTMACYESGEGPTSIPLSTGVGLLISGLTTIYTLPMMYYLATATENIDTVE